MGRGGRRHRCRRGGLWAGLAAMAFAAVGCGDDIAAARGTPQGGGRAGAAGADRDGPAPRRHRRTLPADAGGARRVGYLIDARVLVISADGSESELDAIEQTLGYLGTPYDVFIASQRSTLSTADLDRVEHARQVQRHHPHPRQPAAVERHQRVHRRGVPDARQLRGDVPGAARLALHLTRRGLRLLRLGVAGHLEPRRSRPSARPPGAIGVQLRQLQQRRRHQRRLRLPRDRLGCIDGSAADRFQRADPGRGPRLRRRPRGAVAELRPVAQPVPHAAAVPRRGHLGDEGRVPGRAARLHRRPGRRPLPRQRHLHGRHVPHHRDRFPGRVRLHQRQARPGRHRRDALPHRVQRRRARAPATR